MSKALAALARVTDPELRAPITELGMVEVSAESENSATVTVKLTIAGCPAAQKIERDVREVLAETFAGFDLTMSVMTQAERDVLKEKLRGGRAPRVNPFDAENPAKVYLIGSGKGGGLRVHAALASGCNPNTHLSVRVHLNRLFGLDQLDDFGMFDERQSVLLKQIIAARESFLISGATGSGKTTLLRAMLSECAGDRVIALEDVAELGLTNANFISLQTRQANIEGKGEITLDRLVREALRMRPDRLVVGEVRGAELIVMLQALNTGHRGAGATIHANSFDDVLPRVNAIGRGAGLDAQSILEQMRSAFTWLIHVDHRKVVKIAKFD